jgi:tRNA1(Val) A37 N6-methylase TrmN6
LKTELARLAREALSTSQFKAFNDTLATQTLPTSFGIFDDKLLVALISQQMGTSDTTKWVTRPLTWNSELYNPNVALSAADNLVHLLWQDLSARLARKLDAVAHRTALAARGAVLCFFGRADFSIVVEYARSAGGAIRLKPLAALQEPNGVLEVTNLLHGATAEVRNALKNVAFSVDKLVYQRGCIIHVHRQREDVFGPTIDTVILGELLAEFLDTHKNHKLSALEVGPGSGLLSAILATSEHVVDLTSVDLNAAAVSCTLKNLHINDATLDSKQQVVRVRAERFDAQQFAAPVDLIVCNPPYIPGEPTSSSLSMKEYGRAVGGLDLCIEILRSLPSLLTPDGALLLMASSLSDSDVVACIPDNFEATPALGGDGRRVPLDVDVVWHNPEWRAYLLAQQRIEVDSAGEISHYLRPLWIRRREARK